MTDITSGLISVGKVYACNCELERIPSVNTNNFSFFSDIGKMCTKVNLQGSNSRENVYLPVEEAAE